MTLNDTKRILKKLLDALGLVLMTLAISTVCIGAITMVSLWFS